MEFNQENLATLLGMAVLQAGGVLVLSNDTIESFHDKKYIGVDYDEENNTITMTLADELDIDVEQQ